ncbi:Hypothetical predicted protein [Cloeon dipterum]|uniref:Uncharacterized protein n=1 Tax=Cloeon dipterum TaxID=197152 RepID=A0A8S1CSW7_9INSE|nr:Hypothetical predicted protein [Cloeon dipterum]
MRQYWIFLLFLLSNLWYEFAKSNELTAEEIEFENLVKLPEGKNYTHLTDGKRSSGYGAQLTLV